MKLTLGKAAKEVGISKPSLSAAIKKGKVSAHKNEKGHYEIDPAELFRVYPPKSKSNGLVKQEALPDTNPTKHSKNEVLDLLLGERDKLIAEKESSIKRLEQEKAEIRQDLEDMKDQNKRITLLLEDKREGQGGNKKTELDTKLKKMEESFEELRKQNERLLKKEEDRQKKADERRKQREAEKAEQEKQAEEKAKLEEAEKNKSFFKRMFG